MIRVIEGLAKHSKLHTCMPIYFVDIIETISCIIFIIMFLIRLHARAVGQRPADHDGTYTILYTGNNALCEGSGHARLKSSW